MLYKITQLIKEWFGRMRNLSPLPMDNTLWRPLLILVAITILSYEAIDFFYKMISFPLTKQTVASKANISMPVIKDNIQADQRQDYDIITGRNLFLSTLKAVSDKESEGEFFDADQKTTDFDLKGTVACNSSFGFIFIEERDSHKQKLYRLGDNIGSAKLIKITRNTATLRSGGKETTLRVKATIEGSLLPNSPDAGTNRAASRNVTLNKKMVTENLSDLNSIMSQAVMRPYLNKGVQEGLIISNIAPNSLYEKMGLQNGDIIMDVNNKPMQSADNLLQTVNLIQSGGNIAVNFKRNGKSETIHYSFK
jgi:general secretion pathway protein C